MTTRRALLLNPPSGLYRRDDRCQSKVEDQTIQVNFPPLVLAYAAGALMEKGWQCRIRDYPAAGAGWDRLEADLRTDDYSLVLIAATSPTLQNDLKAAMLARSLHPNAAIAARGEIFSTHDVAILRDQTALDFVLRGENEVTLREWGEGRPIADIPGLTWRRPDGEIARNPDRPLVSDLDTLPRPARELLDHRLYRNPENGRILTTIETARGCPYACIFCSVFLATGKAVRQFSVPRVLDEIDECITRWNIREYLFHADTFTYHRDWVLALCRGIVERGFSIRWGANSRVDTLDREMLVEMKRAGCHTIGFGIESGDEESLRKMKKAAHADKAFQAVALCREVGVRSHAFMVAGFPWDDMASLERTVEFVRRLDPDFFDLNLAHPLPGTELWNLARQLGLLQEERLSGGSYGNPAISGTLSVSQEELVRWRKRSLLKLYFRPRYVGRTLLRAGREGHLSNFVLAGARRLRGLLS